MIVLDTNVVSGPMKPNGHIAVQTWLDRQVAETLYLTATGLSELLVGLEILSDGKRKDRLNGALKDLLERLFGSRILSFDRQAAIAYASLVSRARSVGRILSMGDAQIAAIAAVHGFSVATRDTESFLAAGVPVINPWESHS